MPTTQHRRERAAQINFRASPEEVAEIREQARRRGMTIRQLILSALRYVARLPYDYGFRGPDEPRSR